MTGDWPDESEGASEAGTVASEHQHQHDQEETEEEAELALAAMAELAVGERQPLGEALPPFGARQDEIDEEVEKEGSWSVLLHNDDVSASMQLASHHTIPCSHAARC